MNDAWLIPYNICSSRVDRSNLLLIEVSRQYFFYRKTLWHTVLKFVNPLFHTHILGLFQIESNISQMGDLVCLHLMSGKQCRKSSTNCSSI